MTETREHGRLFTESIEQVLSDGLVLWGMRDRSRDRVENFDLLVVAQDGTFSLEVMDMLRQYTTEMKIFWFSDLDFSVRSYSYGTLWFGKKPVDLKAMRKAFKRVI